MSDAERAREIAVRVTGLPLSEMADEIEAALAAARAEEREAAGDRAECFVFEIAHRWVRLPHNSADGKAREKMLVACARGEMDPRAALAAIRAGGGTSTATPG